MEPWVATWLAHQRRDDYWRQGSACERHAEIACPVFAIGGWSDGYRDMVLRMVEHSGGPVRGLIGPWGHTGPEAGAPGPAIGFLQEVVRFFDHALKGAENGFFDEPALISVHAGADRPGHGLRRAAGALGRRRGVAVAERRDARAGARRRAAQPARPAAHRAARPACGAGTAGRPTAPADQRPEDGASICWDLAPLAERIELLGHVVAELELTADRPVAFVAARLCEVAPDGSSTLIARGVLNLTHREGHDRVVPVVPGEAMTVRVPMQSTAYAVPAGHALRLAVSPTYWPWIWPSPEPVTLTAGAARLELPVRGASRARRGAAPVRRRPSRAPALAEGVLAPGHDGPRRAPRPRPAHGGRRVPVDRPPRTSSPTSGTLLGERNVVHYVVTEGDPLSADGARARSRSSWSAATGARAWRCAAR